MQAQSPSPETGMRTPGWSRWPTIVGICLALALAATIGLAQLRESRGARWPVGAAAGVAGPSPASPVSPATSGLIVYLVGSEDQRASAEAALEMARAAWGGEMPMTWVVDVTATGGDQLVQSLAGEANLIREDGRPALTLVDLRTP